MEPTMIDIPAGEFVMGTPAVPDDFSLHHRWPTGKRVRVGAFKLSRTAITNAEYKAYLDDIGGEPGPWLRKAGYDASDQPVVNISWNDARAYCGWIAGKTGKPYRLPTDTEWEYAARGGSHGTIFPWGDHLDETRAWYGGKPGPKPVASYPPNGFGLYDMIGNIWQWCDDLFSDASGRQAVNKMDGSTDAALNRVLRGGSFLTTNPHSLYIAYRHEDPPALRHQCLGFRVAL